MEASINKNIIHCKKQANPTIKDKLITIMITDIAKLSHMLPNDLMITKNMLLDINDIDKCAGGEITLF